ncbi:hypothetical protein [Amycolatopsis thermophila]|uniref:Uncharacterized protein n=1 Tax=Amycolatopsis thermophila TaxID=206084 RepID=A0ABU0ESJ8_9PSEU|nr:hypothetical protein [Amycolatopsis thermophila]MDQ0378053.1 hypothetical protein [Amycolatopsis thermophila]
MNPDDELRAELRRLFDDERLAVPAPPRAGDAIVAGARRRRRRRNALAASGGVLTAAVLVAAALAVTRPEPAVREAAPPPSAAPRVPSTSAPAPVIVPPSFPAETVLPPSSGAPVPPEAPTPAPTVTRSPKPSSTSGTPRPALPARAVLGPTGYGKLRLGMTFDEAKATGMLAGAGTAPDQCATYRLTEGTGNIASVTISPSGGVVAFTATGARTPENTGTGSTVAELRNAYPDLTAGAGNYSTTTESGDHYTFYVDSGDTVVSWELTGSPGC